MHSVCVVRPHVIFELLLELLYLAYTGRQVGIPCPEFQKNISRQAAQTYVLACTMHIFKTVQAPVLGKSRSDHCLQDIGV